MKKIIAVVLVLFCLSAILLAFYFFATSFTNNKINAINDMSNRSIINVSSAINDSPEQAIQIVPLKIMPLGDSITQGDWNDNLSSYRKDLYYDLIKLNYSVDFVGSMNFGTASGWDGDNEGHGGWSADGNIMGPSFGNIADNISGWLNNSKPDIILLHIGTNDVGQNDSDAYKDVEKILDKIYSYNNETIVFLALIIDRCYDFPKYVHIKKKRNFGWDIKLTNKFNENLSEMALKRAEYNKTLFVVDMHNLLNCSNDYYDNVHPNDKGYSKMADAWFEALTRNYNFGSRMPKS